MARTRALRLNVAAFRAHAGCDSGFYLRFSTDRCDTLRTGLANQAAAQHRSLSRRRRRRITPRPTSFAA